MLVDEGGDRRLADLLGPERLEHDRHRVRDADRVGDLHLAAIREARRDDVLRDPPGRVGGRAIDLRRVLAGERAAAVAGHAAVGVDDDLAARQAAVADRAADDEATRRVDEELLAQRVGVVHVRGQDREDDVLPEVGEDLVAGRVLGVLGGDQELLDRRRDAVDIPHRHLRLAVRAQVVQRAVVADRRELLGELVRERDRQRHELRRLVGRVAEHHALVARAGEIELVVVGHAALTLVGLVDALRDVRRLLVDRVEHGARIGGEPELGVDVADPAHRLAHDLLDVDERLGRDLTGHDDEARVHERLARHARTRIVAEAGVQDAVGDLVGDLVGMTLRDGLGGEEVLVLGEVGHMAGKATGPPRVWTCARRSR